jgi:hypothetical protein
MSKLAEVRNKRALPPADLERGLRTITTSLLPAFRVTRTGGRRERAS